MRKLIVFFILLAGCSRHAEPETPKAQPIVEIESTHSEEAPSPCWEEVKEKSDAAWEITKDKAYDLKEYLRQQMHEATAPEE